MHTAAAAAAAAGTCTIRIISTYTIRLHRGLILRSTDRRLLFAYHATSVHTVGATPYRLHALFFFGADRSPRSLTKSHWHRKTFFPLGLLVSLPCLLCLLLHLRCANRTLDLLHRLWPRDIASFTEAPSRAANSRLVSYLVSTTYLHTLYPPAGSATREDQSPESRAQSPEPRSQGRSTSLPNSNLVAIPISISIAIPISVHAPTLTPTPTPSHSYIYQHEAESARAPSAHITFLGSRPPVSTETAPSTHPLRVPPDADARARRTPSSVPAHLHYQRPL